MPLWQRFAFCQQTVGTGRRQPVGIIEVLDCQGDAVGHLDGTIPVVGTLTAWNIEQAAVHVSEIDFARVSILKAVQAALGATVAQGFPLVSIELFEW